MGLTLIVTNAGRTALVNAANTGTAPVTIAQVGLSGTAVVPAATAMTLPGEFKRLATLSGDVVADDTIHLIVRDEGSDVFTVRSLALYLADGTLFAIYGQAGVLIEKSAQALMLLAIDVRFADIDAASLTFGDANFLNPPATTEQKGVVELSTLAEAIAGTDTSRVPPEKMVKDAVFSWLDARFGANNAGIWHPGNDGSGSGLDADLLDGQDSAYFTNISARLGFTPVQQGTGNGQGANTVKIGWSGTSRLKATVDATDLGNFVFDSNIADVWRASNDGAGSGLDADLLDGQQGSYYTDIIGRLGYTPLNASTYTAADIKAKLLTVDGAGSGLDADLLDGQDSTYYTNIVARLGYTPLNRAGDTLTGPLVFSGGGGTNGMSGGNGDGASYSTFNLTMNVWYGLGIKTYDGSVNGFYDARQGLWDVKTGYRVNGAAVWHSANDGAGSGLDADLLDGQQGGYYTDIVGRLGFTPINKGGDTIAATITFQNNDNSAIASRPSANTPLVAIGNGTGPAIMTFHRPGSFAAFLGLDTDNQLKFGGWSFGAPAYIWHSANDGSGSGMDADMVDGWHRDSIRDWNNLLNKPFNWAGQAGQPSWVWGSNDGSTYYVWNPANFSVNYASSAGNADTVDGYHGSAFDRVTSASYGASGQRVQADGFKKCWGSITIAANTSATVTMPITFGSTPRVIVGAMARSVTTDQENGGLLQGSEGVSTFTIVNGFDFAAQFAWEAFGQ